MTDKRNKVACIIVTYNRLDLLKNCIDSLRNQTCKDFDIIVVNNGSTDGTDSWLHAQTDIFSIDQENCGGAGGFHSGMKYAHERQYEWYWLMDDDGVADSRQLENLLLGCQAHNMHFANALVCDVNNHSLLSFELVQDGKVIVQTEEAQQYEIIDSICPFNGTFVHKCVIDKIGYVKKELFIWGDETNFRLRAIAAKYHPYTIVNAIHYHPTSRLSKDTVWGNKTVIVNIPDWKLYCFVRNTTYNMKIGVNKLRYFYRLFRYVFPYLVYYFSTKRSLVFQAVKDGITSNFTHLGNYMKKK